MFEIVDAINKVSSAACDPRIATQRFIVEFQGGPETCRALAAPVLNDLKILSIGVRRNRAKIEVDGPTLTSDTATLHLVRDRNERSRWRLDEIS